MMGEARPGVFLTAQWLKIVMANFAVDPGLLQPHVPVGTELDLYDDKAWISVVGFLFMDTRIHGIAVPFHRNFEEVNLRFYVRRESGKGVRRAVTFIRELVPRRWVAWTARALYEENYLAVPMRHSIEAGHGNSTGLRGVTYAWGRGAAECRLIARVRGEAAPIRTGSPEEFFADHEWGYSSRRDGSTFEYRVEHPPWRIWPTEETRLEGDLAPYYGRDLASALQGSPGSAFVAEGSPVKVYHGTRIPAAGR